MSNRYFTVISREVLLLHRIDITQHVLNTCFRVEPKILFAYQSSLQTKIWSENMHEYFTLMLCTSNKPDLHFFCSRQIHFTVSTKFRAIMWDFLINKINCHVQFINVNNIKAPRLKFHMLYITLEFRIERHARFCSIYDKCFIFMYNNI